MIVELLAAAAICHAGGSGEFTTPDSQPDCTPGSHVTLTHQEACTPKDRPSLPDSVRREVLTEYGVPNWTGRDGEIDHRVPWFLTHDSRPENLWPEPGTIPNRKDRLEFYVYRRVCKGVPHAMRVRTADRIFLRDWRTAYHQYIAP
jgi:hypothetical protein